MFGGALMFGPPDLEVCDLRREAGVFDTLVIFPPKDEVDHSGVPSVAIIRPPLELIPCAPAAALTVKEFAPIDENKPSRGDGKGPDR